MTIPLPVPVGVLLFILKFLPIPAWLKAVVSAAIVAIDQLPKEERRQAKKEFKEAAKKNDVEEIGRLARRYTEGVGSGPDTKGI